MVSGLKICIIAHLYANRKGLVENRQLMLKTVNGGAKSLNKLADLGRRGILLVSTDKMSEIRGS